MIQEQFVSYDIALKLKELGFNQSCLYNYSEVYGFIENINGLKHSDGNNKFVSAPLYQQVFEFFRSKYNLYHMINPLGYNMCLASVGTFNNLQSCNVPEYGTYRQAEIACINKLIELVQ